jgi:hypothetical protein
MSFAPAGCGTDGGNMMFARCGIDWPTHPAGASVGAAKDEFSPNGNNPGTSGKSGQKPNISLGPPVMTNSLGRPLPDVVQLPETRVYTAINKDSDPLYTV